ncbi:TVP38/TMEM64 family protein [Pelagibaculum spongiae]|uniref:TVP38/TMEM64 family membrane protein n=1 Tax=Pelagibaculum spongiae TaxID=2080658 RepID=A0A2V1H2W5_9GAMM|nr:VTT domain-containing protein [Pelagibaculum spongiae]PVZ69637.1 hypothetical protein DC094_10045 [Pelagibaculum spongiae]
MLSGFAGLALLGVVLWLVPIQSLIQQWIDPAALAQKIQTAGITGMLLFMVASSLTVAIGMPRQIIAITSGFAFGFAGGLLSAIVSISIGALLTFAMARTLARPWVLKRYPQATTTMDTLIKQQAFLKILTLRFLPVGTNMLTNLAAGTSNISAMTFFWASVVGFLPQAAIFVLTGNGIQLNSQSQLWLAGILFIISIILGRIIYKKHKQSTEAIQ